MRPARTGRVAAGGAGARYSRLEAEVSAMQRNSGTYCDEPEDGRDYAAWLAGFDLAARRGEIEAITAGNAFMAELQARIVPLIVQHDVFWTRYFYQCAPPQPPPQRPCPSPFVRTQKGCVPGLCCKASTTGRRAGPLLQSQARATATSARRPGARARPPLRVVRTTGLRAWPWTEGAALLPSSPAAWRCCCCSPIHHPCVPLQMPQDRSGACLLQRVPGHCRLRPQQLRGCPRRLHRLQSAHEARQQLAQRARASASEDAIGWDDDVVLPADADADANPAPPVASEPAPGASAGPAHAVPPEAPAAEQGAAAAAEGAGESAGAPAAEHAEAGPLADAPPGAEEAHGGGAAPAGREPEGGGGQGGGAAASGASAATAAVRLWWLRLVLKGLLPVRCGVQTALWR